MQQRLVTFDCPSCGAPVHSPDTATALRCAYCGNNIMVPENLRAATPSQFGGAIVINTGAGAPLFGGQQSVLANHPGAQKVVQARGCVRTIIFFSIILAIASIVVPTWIGVSTALNAFSSIPGKIAISPPTATPGYARQVLTFGGRGKGPGLFENATDITSDSSGDIYVLEENSGRVQRFDRSGKYLNGWVVEDEHTDLTSIVADRKSSAVYVTGKPKIYKYEGTTGNLLSVPLEKGSGFSPTEDAGLFPNGDLLTYVSGDSDDLVRLDPEGKEVARFTKVFSTVLGKKVVPPAPWNVRLVADASERMLVLHKPDMEVFIYGPDGKYSTRFSAEQDGAGFASDLTVDSKGRIYISHLRGIDVYDYAGRALGRIADRQDVTAIEITAKDELLALFDEKVVKFVPRD